MKVACLLLAAGESKRMGFPKQLLSHQNRYLIENAIHKLYPLKFSPLLTVLGAHFDQITMKADLSKTAIFRHNQWAEGIGSSIAAGANHLTGLSDLDGIMIVLADQPFIPIEHFNRLVYNFNQKKFSIISTRTRHGSYCPPVLFGKEHFDDLCHLYGDIGAKKIIKNNIHSVTSVEAEDLELIDIDSPSDSKEWLLK